MIAIHAGADPIAPATGTASAKPTMLAMLTHDEPSEFVRQDGRYEGVHDPFHLVHILGSPQLSENRLLGKALSERHQQFEWASEPNLSPQ